MTYTHYSEKEKLRDLLIDFFSNQGIGLVCSDTVTDTISGQFKTDDPKRFFDEITHAYNLVWYYDGAAIFVYSAHEITSRILNLGYLDMVQLKKQLAQLNILDTRFGLNMVETDRIVFVSGPPRYVDLVADLAQKLDEKARDRRYREDIINVFPLKHAWADDKILYFHDRELVIPGVVTLLNKLITGHTAPGEVVGIQRRVSLKRTVSKLKGKGLSEENTPAEEPNSQSGGDLDGPRSNGDQNHPPNDPPNASDNSKLSSSAKNDMGVIQADSRQNAVVVRDRKEKMAYYERIISLLDVPVGLVEIRATIMDVNQENLEDLGIEWQFTSTDEDNDIVTRGGLNTETGYTEEEGLPFPVGEGFNVATIIGDARNFFLARVNALQKEGHAKILSRPSVLTLNNVEAQLEHSRTFYIRVAGTEEVDLFDVTAGVVLRVTPHIIEDQTSQRVKLVIQIEDGDFDLSEETVDQIPVVENSIINTQAVVGENESLLIGGYIKDEKNNVKSQIPCLGDVPLVGWLFKSNARTGNKLERLFMITPKMVPYSVKADPPQERPPGDAPPPPREETSLPPVPSLQEEPSAQEEPLLQQVPSLQEEPILQEEPFWQQVPSLQEEPV